MLDNFTLILTVFAVAGSGVVAGIVFTFSNFVMKALGQMPVPAGISAMQRINVAIINPLFMLIFLGTPAASMYLFVYALINPAEAGSIYLLAGSIVYLAGAFLVTIVFNVPRNNALEAVDPESPRGASFWSGYLRSWTAWNHVRTTAALAAAVLLSVALV